MIPCQRALFDIPDEVAYFNCAYLSPLMNSVVAAVDGGIRRKARPWQVVPTDWFGESETARDLFARLVNCRRADVALVPAASYGIAVAAANLPLRSRQTVLVLADQFPSNVYAWRDKAAAAGAKVVTVPRPENGDWTSAILDRIDRRTAIAALAQCHWTDGGLIDLERVAAALREVGAALVLDLTQSLGALPFDIERVRPNFMTAATYKWLLGPYSMGFLYVAPAHQAGRPLEHNWIARAGAQNFSGLVDYRDDYQPGAERYDVGERFNMALLPGVIAALTQILIWGVPEIQETLADTTGRIAAAAAEMGLSTLPRDHRAGHFLGLTFAEGVPAGLMARLAAEQVYVSARGATSIRVTPHLYNSDADVDRLVTVLRAAL